MALKKGMAGSIAALVIIAVLITGVFVYKKVAARNSLAKQIADLSPRGAPPQGIDDLRKAIELYEKKIDEHVRDAVQTGVYWKILGSRLVDKKLYGEALEALEHAAGYNPEDETVHYLIGLCAGALAKSEYFAPDQADRHFEICEKAYLRAISIVPRYSKALYGLVILYAFELNRPEDAEKYLVQYLDINKSDTDAMFVLARARFMTENYQGAVEMYDKIISLTKNADTKAAAEANKQQVMEAWFS
jgi:tetratricopeptide (TPR) repeat protein